MTNREEEFAPPRIMLVKEVNGIFDFGLLPKDFNRFDNFQMLCAGVVVRSQHGFDLLTSERCMLPAGTIEAEMKNWQERAIGFVQSQWRKYVENDFTLPGHPKQQEAFDEFMSHYTRNFGGDVMSEEDIESLEATLHGAFMKMLDQKMGLTTKKGLTGRYAMGGND